jgi:NDP-sugar pyrophosphorylase family protein
MAPLDEQHPGSLIPLLDRPFLQHVVEWLVAHGISRIDFVLSHLPEQVERALGDGSRWGGQFTYHLARDPERPLLALKAIELAPEEGPVLLGWGDRLPLLDLTREAPTAGRPAPRVACLSRPRTDGTGGEWAGWAWLQPELVSALTAGMGEEALGRHLLAQAHERGSTVSVGTVLAFRDPEEVLAAHRLVLAGRTGGLLLAGREIEPGVRVARNVRRHPSVRVVPPVYMAESCRIGPGVQLGPNAVVGAGSVLDERCVVADSVVLPGSYVGAGLELSGVIVDRNRLVNVRVGAAVSVADEFILGSLAPIPAWNTVLARLVARGAGAALLLVAVPALAATWCALVAAGHRPVVRRRRVLRLPAPADEAQWRTFELRSFGSGDGAGPGSWKHCLLSVLPGLWNVARGEVRFVGVAPRSPDEVDALSRDWRALYLRAKAGLVTEAGILYGAGPTDDELYASEAFYAVAASPLHDVRLLGRYVARLLGLAGRPDRGA